MSHTFYILYVVFVTANGNMIQPSQVGTYNMLETCERAGKNMKEEMPEIKYTYCVYQK